MVHGFHILCNLLKLFVKEKDNKRRKKNTTLLHQILEKLAREPDNLTLI